MRYRTLVMADPMLSQHLSVPRVYTQLSTKQVLISTFVLGDPIDKALALSQEIRNAIARAMLVVTIKELFEWRLVFKCSVYVGFMFQVTLIPKKLLRAAVNWILVIVMCLTVCARV